MSQLTLKCLAFVIVAEYYIAKKCPAITAMFPFWQRTAPIPHLVS